MTALEIRLKFRNGMYTNKLTIPDEPIEPVVSKSSVYFDGLMEEFKSNTMRRNNAIREYIAEDRRINAQFRFDIMTLLMEHGSTLKQAERMYDIILQDEYRNGFEAVLSLAERLCYIFEN